MKYLLFGKCLIVVIFMMVGVINVVCKVWVLSRFFLFSVCRFVCVLRIVCVVVLEINGFIKGVGLVKGWLICSLVVMEISLLSSVLFFVFCGIYKWCI